MKQIIPPAIAASIVGLGWTYGEHILPEHSIAFGIAVTLAMLVAVIAYYRLFRRPS